MAQKRVNMSLEDNLTKHVKFLQFHLSLLPSRYESYEVNKFAIVFYAIVSLSVIYQDVSEKYQSNLGWVRSHYTSYQVEESRKKISGFVGSLSAIVPDVISITLPNTLFGLLTLTTLHDREFFEKILDTESLCNFVGKCQLTDGSFVSFLDYKDGSPSAVDSHDLRFCYIAVAILYIAGCRSEKDFNKYINVDNLLKFIKSQECDFGGFGQYGEPHAGYTSCALSTLALLQKNETLTTDFKENTIEWLLQRQLSKLGCQKCQESNEYYDENDHGGFQGRENKYADTCYAFWCLNSLQILRKDWKKLCNADLTKKYILKRTQCTLTGGFSKNDADDADIYHTCLGFAALELIEGNFNGVLCITKDSTEQMGL
ncbi:hypothetical protein KAFR_0B04650 [Kazachstania africana CBS 2517]|uniref:Prenyltransferase alpha-alpha toroid domain-containing protein n=1 Tax=Kazachstania africana (strain ATCC 22294 / BCRC 22015 / CBS 2517 / CECT 1963 / NBRC 1671 / NRRL Y-8276) TaxID=1071382 RepID=H2AQW2_KAZAF|nr:hypothetical protein KAFR_0B04650 [Kazachstania africana CBS 2517]CCF56762.1 hypothetical protein KAFR_0B04650 [Kazachstania africana CBS 2517]